MLERVKKTIHEYRMLSSGDKVVVGVSGGADSMALLHILSELKDLNLELTAAHLNHGIRGEEADRDSEFVEEASSRLGLRFEHKEVDTLAYKEENKLSLEDAARELRYEFFNEVRKRVSAAKVATAHTLDDQAETVLMRLLRGSGLKGLSGIPPVSRGYLIRPLLFTSRKEIEEYLTSGGVGWVQDSSNESGEFLRNKIRQEIVPTLETYNPNLRETLSRSARVLRSDFEFIMEEAEKRFKDVFSDSAKCGYLGDLDTYKNTQRALRLSCLRLSIEKANEGLEGISYDHIAIADEFLLSDSTSGESDFPGQAVISKGYDKFIVTTKTELSREFCYKVESTGISSFPEFEVEIIETTSDIAHSEDESEVTLSASSIQFPIVLRSFKPGDKFMPLGMKNFKKVQDYFTDVKLPRFLRNRVPIFLSKGEIFWIGGMRLDERARLKGENQKALRFKLTKSFTF